LKWSCRQSRRLSVAAAYGELTEGEQQWLERHHAGCKECSAFRADVQATLMSIPRAPSAEGDINAAPDFWPTIVRQLQQESHGEKVETSRLLDRITKPWKYGLAASLAAVLIIGGVVVGRYLIPAPESAGVDSTMTVADQELLNQIHRTQEYLDRTRTLLLGILNREPASSPPAYPNLKKQREVSRRLVSEGRKLHAELSGDDQGLQRLLIEEIEDLLLQLANLEESHATAGLKTIQNGAEQRGILLKISIEDMKIAEEARRASASKQIL
jgi:hypothetical protein